MNHLKFIILILALPCCLSAQVDLSLFPHYNAELMEDLGITNAQVQAIETLNARISAEQTKCYEALLFRPDLKAAMATLEAERIATLHKIIQADQVRAYQQFIKDTEVEQRVTDLKRYKEMYVDVYHYLKIDDKQAQRLANLELDVRDGKRQGEDYTTLKTDLLKEILSEKQWKKYAKKRKKERIAATTKNIGSISYLAVEEQMLADMEKLEKIIPPRLALRRSLEQQMSQQDRQNIQQLRRLYEDKQANRTQAAQVFESIAAMRDYEQRRREQVIDQHYTVNNVIHHERAIFEKAKALGIKFDKAIDALQPQLWELEKLRYDEEQGLSMRGITMTKPDKEVAMTERIELTRNIAFLLIPIEESIAGKATKHQLIAYPTPARVTQSLNFEVQTAGIVRIELLDAQGKMVKILAQERLHSGTHKREFDLSNLPSGIFFYRVESEGMISLLKSLKVD